MRYKALILMIFVMLFGRVAAQQFPFSQKVVSLPQLGYSAIAWADYDHDGDLDLALSGVEGNDPVTKIMRNDSGSFTDIQAGLLALHYGSIEWGDYDMDFDLDLLVTGMNTQGDSFTKIFTNTGGTFSDSGSTLPGVSDGQACWGDYNNDGLLDILLAGSMTAEIFRNDGNGLFTDINAPLPAVQSPMCCWCDYNNDGQADVLVCGDTGGGFWTTLFKNEGGVFTEVSILPEPFTGLYSGQAKWADLDNDGDQDLVLSGMDLYIDAYLLVYRNDGNDQFTKFTIPNGNLLSGSLDLGDFDSNGLTDIIVMGRTPGCGGNAATVLLQNNGFMNFFPVSTLLPGYKMGSVSWGDYNNDGHSDLIFTGLDGFDIPQTDLYLNNMGDTTFTLNTSPTMPTGLSSTMDASKVILHWSSATDSQTPTNSLTYNIRIGVLSDSYEILAPLSVLYSGSRMVAAPGNVSADTNWTISGIPEGTYYFSVQAIDNGYMPGAFSMPYQFSYQPVGMSEIQNGTIGIYPNPCTDFINLRSPFSVDDMDEKDCGEYIVTIINSLGTVVYSGPPARTIEVSTWPRGIYMVQADASGNRFSGKFTKN